MSFFYKIKLRERTRLGTEWANHWGVSVRQRALLWKENTTLSTKLQNRAKTDPPPPVCSCPSLTSETPFLFSKPRSLWDVRGLPFLLSRERKPGRKARVAVTGPPRPQAVRTSGPRPTTHLAGAAVRRVARSGWAGQSPDPRCPRCPRRPRYLRRRHHCPRRLLPSCGSCPSPGRPTWPASDCRSPVPAALGPAALAEPPCRAPLETQETGKGERPVSPGTNDWPTSWQAANGRPPSWQVEGGGERRGNHSYG